MNLIDRAIKEFERRNNSKLTRLERHEALKAILYGQAESGTVEYPMPYEGRRGRIDFVGDGYAVELDHSMKQRSMTKLTLAKEAGLIPVWIILRPTFSYPRKYGRMKRMANDAGIEVRLLRGLQGDYRPINKPRKGD